MKLSIALGETFIPTWNGNDKSESPIKFKLRYLRPDERESIGRFGVPVGNSKRGVTFRVDNREAFCLGVDSIENLSIEHDGGEVAIKTADDFLKYPLPEELYQEVALRIRNTSGLNLPN